MRGEGGSVVTWRLGCRLWLPGNDEDSRSAQPQAARGAARSWSEVLHASHSFTLVSPFLGYRETPHAPFPGHDINDFDCPPRNCHSLSPQPVAIMALAPLGVQVRPYRDYLTPALHRRFNKASRYTLLLCYLIACWMGEWDNRK
jgi:hypothetical protein